MIEAIGGDRLAAVRAAVKANREAANASSNVADTENGWH